MFVLFIYLLCEVQITKKQTYKISFMTTVRYQSVISLQVHHTFLVIAHFHVTLLRISTETLNQ